MAGHRLGPILVVPLLTGLLAVGLEEDSEATSCAGPPPGAPSDYELADIVVEGVVLSGPSRGGSALSPARFHVTRYVKGQGPRVRRIGTLARQVEGRFSSDSQSQRAGTYEASAGETYRIFGDTSRRARRELGGITRLGAPCTGDHFIPVKRVMRGVRGTRVSADAGRTIWRAQLFRGRGRLSCLRLGRRPGSFYSYADCRRVRRHGSTLLTLARRARTTGVAIAGSGLAHVEVTRLTDGQTWTAALRGGVGVAAIPGTLEREDVQIVARYRDGAIRTFFGGPRRATASDGDGTRWVADFERAHPRAAGRTSCVAFEQPIFRLRPRGNDAPRYGECGDLRAHPFYFAIGRHTEYFVDEPFERVRQTVVFGAITPAVREVLIGGRTDTTRADVSARGRAFLSLLPGEVPPSGIKVTFRMRDGSTRSYAGRAAVNLGPLPPEPPF